MKKLLRNTFGLMIIAWSFLLNGYELLGIFVGTFVTVYVSYYLKISNYWRVISLFLGLSFISYFVSTLSNIMSIYHLLLVFLIVMSLNTALVNEICLKLRKDIIAIPFSVICLCMIIGYLMIIVVPNALNLPFYKVNLVLLTSLIFIPSFMVTGLNLTYKSLRVRREPIRLYN